MLPIEGTVRKGKNRKRGRMKRGIRRCLEWKFDLILSVPGSH